jgi:4-hydroxybenzoate polyprenyltransferase and related prenyltransferases
MTLLITLVALIGLLNGGNGFTSSSNLCFNNCHITCSSIQTTKRIERRRHKQPFFYNCNHRHVNIHGSPLKKWKISCLEEQNGSNNKTRRTIDPEATLLFYKCVFCDYFYVLRPKTILQAVGSFLVGRLILLASSTTITANNLPQFNREYGMSWMFAIASTYISYGAGMVMNDAADVDLDAKSKDKHLRAVASGKISTKSACIYSALLSMISVVMGSLVSFQFVMWTMMNILLMVGYALGLQKIPLVKNVICGLLAISPLAGASFLCTNGLQKSITCTTGDGSDGNLVLLLTRVAMLGFMMQFAREILKDVEDVEIDKGKKMTLPMLIGERASHRIAYCIVAMALIMSMFIPYWHRSTLVVGVAATASAANSSPIPLLLYPFAVTAAIVMCTKASTLPVDQGQQLIKKSINVLLAGMISALVIPRIC